MMLSRGRWHAGAVMLLLATYCALGTAERHTNIRRTKDTDYFAEIDANWRKTEVTDPRRIQISGDEFMLDGAPLHIMSGSVHYFRSPQAEWRRLLRLTRAAGLNAVSTYVEWSFHEPEERAYEFTGDRDLGLFVRTAQEEGLLVLLRPGPYICAERDLGGLPYWLLTKYPNIRLRTVDKDFIRETEIWMEKLFKTITPLLYGNGGPIILVQVENEYGSYGDDRRYMGAVRDILSRRVGGAALLYTTDGSSPYYVRRGSVDGALTTIDFGVGVDVNATFTKLRELMPRGPLMNSEFYTGWLTHWGEALPTVAAGSIVETLKEMLRLKINFNFYMFHGGTNFEYYSGANFDMDTYKPTITSYDYVAPLDEYGRVTGKYTAIKQTIEEHLSKINNVPVEKTNNQRRDTPPPPKNTTVTFKVQSYKYKMLELLSPEGRSLLGKVYEPVSGSTLPTFEKLGQRSGLVLYETAVYSAVDASVLLQIEKPRDRVYVFIDNNPQGIISRMTKILSLPLRISGNVTLSLLVENQGRINYGSHLHDFKGILSKVLLDSTVLDGKWSITGFPLESVPTLTETLRNTHPVGPVLFEFPIEIPIGITTFRLRTGTKGSVWINGNNVGRYWNTMRPHVDLYVPDAYKTRAGGPSRVHALELERAFVPPAVTLHTHHDALNP